MLLNTWQVVNANLGALQIKDRSSQSKPAATSHVMQLQVLARKAYHGADGFSLSCFCSDHSWICNVQQCWWTGGKNTALTNLILSTTNEVTIMTFS